MGLGLKTLISTLVLLFIGLTSLVVSLPIAKCRYCKNCQEATNTTKQTDLIKNQTDGFVSTSDETIDLINIILDDQDANVTKQEINFFIRSKRQSFMEKKPCPPRSFQWELFLIPASIMAIPLVLVCFLLCACFCGHKEERARLPKVWHVKPRDRKDTANELYFRDDYVMRRNSQKTRFNTRVTIIERRRESAVTVASNPSDAPDATNTKWVAQSQLGSTSTGCAF